MLILSRVPILPRGIDPFKGVDPSKGMDYFTGVDSFKDVVSTIMNNVEPHR